LIVDVWYDLAVFEAWKSAALVPGKPVRYKAQIPWTGSTFQ
jgi:hypothetical protein